MGILSLALRSLTTRPSRTVLTTFGIVLGVAVILAISITNRSTLDSLTAVFQGASGKANLVITSSDIKGDGFRDDTTRQVASAPGVKLAVPSLQPEAVLADQASSLSQMMNIVGTMASGFTLYGIDPTVDQQVRDYRIVEGQFLPPDLEAYEIVMVKDYADQNHIQVGRDVKIITPNGVESLRVVGLIAKEGAGQMNNGAFGAVPLGAAQKMFGRAGRLDQIDIVAQPQFATGAALDNLIGSLQERLGDKYLVTYPASQGKRVIQMLDMYSFGLTVFSAIALFVGAFLIYNAFSMTVVERIREIGMLRAVGMIRRQVMQQILTEAAILGVVGSVLGVGAGILLARGLIRVMEFLLAQAVREVSVPIDGLVTSILVGIIVTLLAAAIPAWQASRTSPLEALRVRGKSDEGWLVRRGWIAGIVLLVLSIIALYGRILPSQILLQIGSLAVFAMFVGSTLLIPGIVTPFEGILNPLFRRLYGNEGKIGSSNIQRAKLRTTLTVAALMVGVAMILGIRAMTDAFKHDVNAWVNGYIGGDMFVHSNGNLQTDMGQRLEALEGVAQATPLRYLDVQVIKPDGESDHIVYMAVDPQSYRQVTSFTFAANQGDPGKLLDRLAQGDVVFLSSTAASKYGLKQGDSIRLETRRGQRDFEIAAITVDYFNRGYVVDGSWKDMRRYLGIDNVSAFLVKIQPGYTTPQVQDIIEGAYGKSRHIETISNQLIRSQVLMLTTQAFGLFDVLALIAMVVAAFGVINTLTMSVLERTQEIGMLRAIGMTRFQVIKMVLAEAGDLGLIGGLFGLGLGLFLSTIFIEMSIAQGYEVAYVLPTEGIVVGLLISLVVSQLAALWPARRASSLAAIEAVRYE